MPMSEETRKTIDRLRAIIRTIGATLKGLHRRLDEIEDTKTGPGGEIDLKLWKDAEHVRERIQGRCERRDKVQARLNDLLREYRANRVVPALREKGMPVRDLIAAVQAAIPSENRSSRKLRAALDEALATEDEGRALGKLLDLFLYGEVRGPVGEILGIELSNGRRA
jgi:hypothetical protein